MKARTRDVSSGESRSSSLAMLVFGGYRHRTRLPDSENVNAARSRGLPGFLYRRGIRVAGIALATAICMALAFNAVNLASVGKVLGGIKLGYATIAVACLLLNAMVALARFRVLLDRFGYSPGWRRLFVAYCIGVFGNQFVFSIVGQSIGRASVLASSGVPFAGTIVATLVERTIAACVLGAAAVGAAWLLLPNLGFEFRHGGAYFVSLIGGLVLATISAVAVSVRRDEPSRAITSLRRGIRRFWSVVLLTIVCHFFMLGGYLAVLLSLGLENLTLKIGGAALIVMFAAALPISLSGWGVRELSAVAVFASLGTDPSTALAAGLVIGILSLGVNLAVATPSLWFLLRRGVHEIGSTPPSTGTRTSNWNARLLLACGTLTAVTIFFQARIQGENALLASNVADVFALAGLGCLVVAIANSRGRLAELPRAYLGVLFTFSLLLTYGLILGYANFGSNSWALINRGFGWLVILGYAGMGIALALLCDERTGRRVLRLFVAVGATLAALQMALLIASKLGFPPPKEAFRVPLRGYANNANAFAFQMTMTAISAIVADRVGVLGAGRRWPAVVLFLTGLAIYFSASRTGIGMFVMLLILYVLFALPEERRAALTTSVAAATSVVLAAVAIVRIPVLNGAFGSGRIRIRTSGFDPDSDPDRWQTLMDGWYLWLERPIFGQGLGAYVESQLADAGQFQVPHSVPLWWMSEMGIIGLVVGVACFGWLALCACRMMRSRDHRAWGTGLMMALICWGAASMIHDLFYQRTFWFFVGLAFGLLPNSDVARPRWTSDDSGGTGTAAREGEGLA